MSELLDDWHPLDGVPAPEYLPGVWTPEHLGVRVVGSFLVLRMAPDRDTVRGFSTAWPVYSYSTEDLKAQAEQEVIEAGKRKGPGRPSARFRPTGLQLQQLDMVLGWLLAEGVADPGAVGCICRWAQARAEGGDNPQSQYGRDAIARGLANIATRLNREAVPVF